MSKKNILTTSAASLLLIAGMSMSPAQASEVKYNYLEGRYVLDAETDNNIDGDGYQIGGSFRIDTNLYAFGSYQALDLDFNNDIDTFEVGAGYIHPLNAKWDANFSASLVNMDVNNNDDTGFSLTAGVRGMVTPNIEGRAILSYIDVEDDDTFITLGGDYFFTPDLSVGVEVDLAGDLETLSIGARYYF
jgi:opacity protein-like surface antigen